LVFFSALVVAVSACQSQSPKVDQPETVPRSDWAKLNLEFHRINFSFPGRLKVNSVNGEPLLGASAASLASRRYMSCRDSKSCDLRPGAHYLEFTYVWSKTLSVEDKKKKNRKEALATVLVLAGGLPDAGTWKGVENSRCDGTLEFNVAAGQQYQIRIEHNSQLSGPDYIQLLDMANDVVEASQGACEIVYETAPIFSAATIPDTQCAVHILAAHRDLMTFYIDGSHPYYSARSNHTFFLNPGAHGVGASFGRKHETARPEEENITSIECVAGEARFFFVETNGNFWAERPILVELSEQDAKARL